MKFVFSGSRNWRNKNVVGRVLDLLPPGSVIVHGAAPGLDTIVNDLASKKPFSVVRYPASWDEHGKAAGPIRNREMLAVRPDRVYCFHPNMKESRGTKDMYTECIRRYIPVTLIDENGNVVEKYDGENDLLSISGR